MPASTHRVEKIAGFGITSPNAARLASFYQSACGAKIISTEHLRGPDFEHSMAVTGGALCYHLELGHQRIGILQFDTPGRSLPHDRPPSNPAFQHFAIVVSDMGAAMAHLQTVPAWLPLSIGGPQLLPRRSGGVTAFKFQDPDGHPLELLEFAAGTTSNPWHSRRNHGTFLGIDHSAISVRDSEASKQFYRALGFVVTSETYNYGKEQALLDGVPDPHVDVTAMSPPERTPHLELLCYRTNRKRAPEALASNDVAATRTYLMAHAVDKDTPIDGERYVVDPDGHHLIFVSRLDHLF